MPVLNRIGIIPKKIMNTKSIRLLAFSVSLLGLAAQAQPKAGPGNGSKGERPTPAQIVERMDADSNGSISADEARGPLAEHFDKADIDGSGEITLRELAVARSERQQRRQEGARKLKGADTDGSGTISKAEATAARLEKMVEHFDQADVNGDGELTKKEMKAARKAEAQKKTQSSGIVHPANTR